MTRRMEERKSLWAIAECIVSSHAARDVVNRAIQIVPGVCEGGSLGPGPEVASIPLAPLLITVIRTACMLTP